MTWLSLLVLVELAENEMEAVRGSSNQMAPPSRPAVQSVSVVVPSMVVLMGPLR